ncbi:MAG: hypothetical protein Q4A66_05865 [Eubacteriales bacterium]|nr:hypothetical protein [Eubacteriales bacterium]
MCTLRRTLRRTALALFAVVLCTAFCWAYLISGKENGAPAALPFALGFGALFVLAGRALQRAPEERAQRVFRIALPLTAAAYVAASVWFMHTYRYTPVWDPDAVFTGAQNWLAGSLTSRSTPTFDAQTYFYYFPNNLGATFVLRGWFALTRGWDPYIAACALNCVLSTGMILCAGGAARELGGARMGLLALLVLGCTLPLWFSCAAFYTDFLSICFPVGALFFALRAERAASLRTKALLWTAAGVMAALGAMIKITVLIMPIALVLWQLLRGKWRAALGLALAAGLLFALGQFVLHKSLYPSQLDPQRAAQMNTPVQHWVMMGLRGDGAYNPQDYAFTRSFADAREAKAAINGEIVRRIGELGPAGFLRHLARKTGIALSDGTLMLSDYYDDAPAAPQWLQELLLPGGENYGLWRAACNGVHMAQLALALLGCVRQLRRGGEEPGGAMYLALPGLLLFLSLWETSRRYWINFLPVLVLCAAQGALGRNGKRIGKDGAEVVY